jgi:hypothetical protein
VEHSHPPVYEIVGETLVATAPGSDPLLFERLAELLDPPCFLLYVLHTPRGEGEPGRYQSDALSRAEIASFLNRFSSFLQRDSRFDLWIHAPTDGATLVWDRHNLIHGYGPVPTFAKALDSLGFLPGTPEIPTPHEHHYHAALDQQARELLVGLRWHWKPLQPQDEQRPDR